MLIFCDQCKRPFRIDDEDAPRLVIQPSLLPSGPTTFLIDGRVVHHCDLRPVGS